MIPGKLICTVFIDQNQITMILVIKMNKYNEIKVNDNLLLSNY